MITLSLDIPNLLLGQTGKITRGNFEILRDVIRKRMKDDISIGIESDCITRIITTELMTFYGGSIKQLQNSNSPDR